MKTFFRLYADSKTEFESSIFDLISGEKETKQTKGLAYIFSHYEKFLFSFLEYKPIKDNIKKCLKDNLRLNEITSLEISAERPTIDNKRADIIIKIDCNKKPLIAIIIEAKSIKTNIKQEYIEKQILSYLGNHQFPELAKYNKMGVALTKYNLIIPSIVSVSWENIVQLLIVFCKNQENNVLINQYLNFLTHIDKSMKYFEEEVLSIPAGLSFERVTKYHIYSCPNTKSYNSKKPLFVTFRQAHGGVMNKLYKIV